MAPISKEFKIVLAINMILGLIYGIMYFIIPEIIANLRDLTNFDPHFTRLFGATCISLAVFALIALIRAEWERIKIMMEFAILWLTLVLITNFIALATTPFSATALISQWIDNIVVIILILIDISFYMRESKK